MSLFHPSHVMMSRKNAREQISMKDRRQNKTAFQSAFSKNRYSIDKTTVKVIQYLIL